ncbi:hypothetical protein DEO72_LG5g1885 [Vigna unguiculata]|uniref:Uncharacterized protein n=1 Tax=Vigna unguiculata TaxID=3917 RepID=A0A4D6LXS2_VIGUN|nr:hypothetical protein DEO72_LG5g1885 [Vigna unguiculata]
MSAGHWKEVEWVGFTGEAGTRTLWSDSGVAPGGSLLAARRGHHWCSTWQHERVCQAIRLTSDVPTPCGAWRQGCAPPGGGGKTMALEERWRLAAGMYRQAIWACFARRSGTVSPGGVWAEPGRNVVVL